MGGRKGYPLSKIIKETRKIAGDKKDLLKAIKNNDVNKVVSSSTKILSKSDAVLEALAHSFLFIGSLSKKDVDKLKKETIRNRKLDITRKWAKYRKEKDKSFDPSVNRDIVDIATKTLGGDK